MPEFQCSQETASRWLFNDEIKNDIRPIREQVGTDSALCNGFFDLLDLDFTEAFDLQKILTSCVIHALFYSGGSDQHEFQQSFPGSYVHPQCSIHWP